jgi:hypothetical protein
MHPVRESPMCCPFAATASTLTADAFVVSLLAALDGLRALGPQIAATRHHHGDVKSLALPHVRGVRGLLFSSHKQALLVVFLAELVALCSSCACRLLLTSCFLRFFGFLPVLIFFFACTGRAARQTAETTPMTCNHLKAHTTANRPSSAAVSSSPA